jgi:hypothetical protein
MGYPRYGLSRVYIEITYGLLRDLPKLRDTEGLFKGLLKDLIGST